MFPALPTDNLYKLMMVGGLFLLALYVVLDWQSEQTIGENDDKAREVIIAYFGPAPEQQKKLGDLPNRLFETKDSQRDEKRKLWAAIDTQFAAVDEGREEKRTFRQVCIAIEKTWAARDRASAKAWQKVTLGIIGLIIYALGLFCWKVLQGHADRKARYEADKVEKEVTGKIDSSKSSWEKAFGR